MFSLIQFKDYNQNRRSLSLFIDSILKKNYILKINYIVFKKVTKYLVYHDDN